MLEISTNLQAGKARAVKELIQKAIDDGMDAGTILEQGLLDGMGVIGTKFKNDEIYVPEVLIGCAPVTDMYRESIGADIYTPDAASAAEEAVKVLTE